MDGDLWVRLCDHTESDLSPECVPEALMSKSQSMLGTDCGIKSHTSPPASVSAA